MFEVVSSLPDGVEISQHLCDKAAKRRLGKKKFQFFKILLYGRSFYVPITNEVWEAFRLKNEDFREYDDETCEGKKFKGVECSREDVRGMLQQLVDAISLQVRDNVLDGVEQSVMRETTSRLEQALRGPVRKGIEAAADERLAKELPGSVPPKEVTDGQG